MNGTHRFTARAGNYARCRPGYPPGVLDLFRSRGALTPASVVADVGSGTGIFTRLLLEAGNLVYAVEPNDEMRAAAERALAAWPNFRSVAAPAEATGLAEHSIDLITAAQAAHWFDIPRAKVEFRRISKPGGWLALVWNTRRKESTPFLRDYEALLIRRGTADYREISGKEEDEERVRELFAPAAFERHPLESTQPFDCDGLVGRTLSCSYAPQSGHPNHSPLLAELRELFELHARNGHVTIEYHTRVYVGYVS